MDYLTRLSQHQHRTLYPIIENNHEANVKVFDANANQLASFFAYSPSFTGGVTVGTIDPTNRGTFEIVTGPGSGGPYYPGPAANLYGFNGQKYAFITSIVAYGKAYTGGIWVS